VSLSVFSVAVLFTSLGAGVVGAILGLGGGILLVPILTIFYGVDLHYAMGASIISVIATSSGAAASDLRTGRVVDINALRALAPLPRAPVPRPSRPQPRTPPPAGAAGAASRPCYI